MIELKSLETFYLKSRQGRVYFIHLDDIPVGEKVSIGDVVLLDGIEKTVNGIETWRPCMCLDNRHIHRRQAGILVKEEE